MLVPMHASIGNLRIPTATNFDSLHCRLLEEREKAMQRLQRDLSNLQEDHTGMKVRSDDFPEDLMSPVFANRFAEAKLQLCCIHFFGMSILL